MLTSGALPAPSSKTSRAAKGGTQTARPHSGLPRTHQHTVGSMNRRTFSRLLTIALFAGALALGTATEQNITLDMPSWQATEPGTSDWWKALIAEFEAQHPGVTIEFTHEPFAGYNDKMVTRFAAGNTPDILHLPAANFMIYAQEGWLAPLDDRLAE